MVSKEKKKRATKEERTGHLEGNQELLVSTILKAFSPDWKEGGKRRKVHGTSELSLN